MTSTAFLLLALTFAVAVADWIAVGADRRGVEYVAKPLTMVVLIGVALSIDPGSDVARGAFVVGLVLSLAGDVLLMLPDDRLFVFGLGSFLAAHLAYVVGLVASGVTLGALLVGLVLVVVAVLVIGRPIIRAVMGGDQAALTAPVALYIGVISLMVAMAVGTRNPFAIAGACLFYSSDALIAWTRFVRPHPWGRVTIMVTYHLGQIGLVLSLI